MISGLEFTTKEIATIKEKVAILYKDEAGNPFHLTEGQAQIFTAIYKKKVDRLHIEAFTRYGKSETISMAVLTRVMAYPEKWAIVAGNQDKAHIIISDIIKHIFDNEGSRAKFVIGPGETEENIRRYRNKDRINFKVEGKLLGEVFITTASGALGFGAPNVVCDESALINEKDYALVARMIGDKTENMLIEVGNPWESEHFRKSFEDPKYAKIIIDYVQGIKEGRITPALVDEAKTHPFFDVLYECKFPKSGIIDEKGWVSLLSREEISNAMVDPADGFGIKKLGVDVAGGGRNFSVIVKRYTNIAKIALRNQDPDTMNLAETTISLMNKRENYKYDFYPNDTGIDKVGLGKGVYDIVNRQCPGVWGINGGDEPTDLIEKEKYVNMRAELFWKARQWILGGGKLERDDVWYELVKIKYRTKLQGTKGKMQIISKEEMLKDGIQSPDVADAFSFTFRVADIPHQEEYNQEQGQEKKWDPWNPFPDI